MQKLRCLVALLISIGGATPAVAQNWSFDARKIALGDAGGTDHPASRMIDEEREYRGIVLPFGLIQVVGNWQVFNPTSDEFDIVRSVEYAAAPIHYVVGRDSSESDTGRRLSVDIRNATLSRDLNAYRGFVPAQQPTAEGLLHTTYGVAIPVARGDRGAFHAVYAGAGPYLSMRTTLDIDQQLIDLLASDTDVYRPHARFGLGIDSRNQLALSITGGYRGRYAIDGTPASERDGLYVAVDYNFLKGFRYENFDTSMRLDTDDQGLLTVDPLAGAPLVLGREHSSSGRGYAVDAGVGVVADRVEVGFGVKGLVNRLEWNDVERTTHALGNLFEGGDFDESATVPIGGVGIELPRDVHAYAAYRTDTGLLIGDVGKGFQGTSFHGGYEHRFGAIELRGGGLYSRDRWQPTGGVGLNMGNSLSLDLAAFGTSANVERKRRLGLAVSLRFNQR
jgi:hypothetical protein